MSNLDDIFDLQGQNTNDQAAEKQPEKKPRKKAEMSDEKKTAMLERLRAGREKRQDNLKAKKEPKEEVKQLDVIKQPEVKKEVVKEPKIKNKTQGEEDERLSFIKMMAGKSKPIENNAVQKRPKKKVYSEPKEEQIKKPEVINKIKEEPKQVSAPVTPIIAAPVVIAKQPVIIRTFKKPIWG